MVLGLLILLVLLAVSSSNHRQHIRKVDERVVLEVESVLTSKLRSLPEDDEIVQRYGKFVELTNVAWRRTRDYGNPTEYLEWSATACFETAQAPIHLNIGKGRTFVIQRLETRPSEQWRQEHPRWAGELVLINGEYWHVNDALAIKSRCTIVGSIRHPELYNNVEESVEKEVFDPDKGPVRLPREEPKGPTRPQSHLDK